MGNNKSKTNSLVLSEPQFRLLEHNTGMSRREIEAWHRQFITEFPDGNIDQKEFAQIFKRTYPNGNPEKYAKIAFKAFDDNKSGKITFDEFLLATSFVTRGHGDREKAIDFAFDIYDSDNNGKITKKEMEQMVSALYELNGQNAHAAKSKVTEIFKKFDLDHNNSLDKPEFVNFMLTDPICASIFHL